MTTIMGIKLDNRHTNAVEFQKILTEFGCSIKTRIGLHEVTNNVCSPDGIILLEVIKNDESENLEKALRAIEGINIQLMQF